MFSDLIKNFFAMTNISPSRIYCGFSGGADSTALLLLLDEYCRKKNIPLCAVHFEHGLRGKEGIEDANWCRKFCESRKINCQIFSLNACQKAKRGESIEETARRLRIEKWKEITATQDNSFIALAHNADDRIENLFLRLFRGSNSTGLVSLKSVQKLEGMTFIRPLLTIRRSQIEEFLRLKGISDWRIDSSNLNSEFRRNFLRNSVFPIIKAKIPDFDKAILKSLDAIAYDADFIELAAENAFQKLTNKKIIPLKTIITTHRAVFIRLLRKWISYELEKDFIPDGKLLERVISEAAKFAPDSFEHTKREKRLILIPLTGKHFLSINKEGLRIQQKTSRTEFPKKVIWNWKTKKQIAWNGMVLRSRIINKAPDMKIFINNNNISIFDAELLPSRLILRHIKEGDRMTPFGNNQKNTRLKKIFESAKISSEEKWKHAVLCLQNDTIIWIPEVRRSNFAPMSANTAKFAIFEVLSP